MHAIQTSFSTPQNAPDIKNPPKHVPNEAPKEHQQPSKIHLETPKGPLQRTLVPEGRRTDAKGVPQGPQNAPKRVRQAAANLCQTSASGRSCVIKVQHEKRWQKTP